MSVIQYVSSSVEDSRVQFGDPTKSTAKFASFTQGFTDIEQITQETLELKAKTCFKVGILMTQLKEELRNETGECVTEGTRRSSKLCSVWQTDIDFGSKFVDFLSGWLRYASHTLFTTRLHCM
ncbi:uncharacterized protein [Dysidea avara]|uniref:uncharacterized protein isoform X2 n=1 Tax=Dysidea avara TaxID=196820 RepID=UPI00331920E3